MSRTMRRTPRSHRHSATRRHPRPEPVRSRSLGTSLRDLKPIARNRVTPGLVVYADIVFAEGTGSKARPSVVLCIDGDAVTLVPLTGSPRPHRIPVEFWAEAGLNKCSFFEPRTVTVDRRTAITGVVGSLEVADFERLAVGLMPPAPSTSAAFEVAT